MKSALVVTTIARTLGIREGSGRPVPERLQDYLRDKHVLLVLDNFEQIVAAGPAIAALLATAPALTVLVTSRVVLHLSGEYVVPVSPLALPDSQQVSSIEELTCSEAVALFVARAQAAMPDFALIPANACAVAEICQRLDGLPLAIELAAARLKLLSPEALSSRLDRRLPLLTGGPRDRPAHQQTVRNTIAWSYQLLNAGAQTLFRRLAVFAGGWTLDAAEAICHGDGDLPMDVLDGLAALVDQSLVQHTEIDGPPRFHMLETIREYALEQLAASGEENTIRRRHAVYSVALAEQAEPLLQGPDQRIWLDRLDIEHGNLRAALGWMLERGELELGLRLSAALWRFWLLHGYVSEGQQWLERALAQPNERIVALRVKALYRLAYFGWWHGSDCAQTGALAEECRTLARDLGDRQSVAWALNSLSRLAHEQGDYPTALAMSEESLALFRALGDTWGQSEILNYLGYMLHHMGDYAAALTQITESLMLARALGDTYLIAIALFLLGTLGQAMGPYRQAESYYTESVALFRSLGEQSFLLWALLGLGIVAQRQGDHARATALLVESLNRFYEIRNTVGIASCLENIAGIAGVMGHPARAVRLFGLCGGSAR